MKPVVAILLSLAIAGPAWAVECVGDEFICADLTTEADAQAAGGRNDGGAFETTGYLPSADGGLVFELGGADLQFGRIAFDTTGLVPTHDGEATSLFAICGKGPDAGEYVGLEHLPEGELAGHGFRLGMDDDHLEDDWDTVLITGVGERCPSSLLGEFWGPFDSHHIEVSWGPGVVTLTVDDLISCDATGNDDGFDPIEAVLVLGNGCGSRADQPADARFTNLRLSPYGGAAAGLETEPETQPGLGLEPEPQAIPERDPQDLAGDLTFEPGGVGIEEPFGEAPATTPATPELAGEAGCSALVASPTSSLARRLFSITRR